MTETPEPPRDRDRFDDLDRHLTQFVEHAHRMLWHTRFAVLLATLSVFLVAIVVFIQVLVLP
jgi:hypothetical protein